MQNMNLYNVNAVKEILLNSRYAVFFGGAGVSTDSGIPDFRGNGGFYSSGGRINEYYLSRECLLREPCSFFEFFRKNMLFEGAKPNSTHTALARLEERGILKSVITQNIDGLHQSAGSRRVIELHGTASRFYCTRCGKVFGRTVLEQGDGIPECDECGAVVRPDVTLYGEALNSSNLKDAVNEIEKADVLIVGGSSLVVNPAASLVGKFGGECLAIVNYSPTPYDFKAQYVIRESLSEVMAILAGE